MQRDPTWGFRLDTLHSFKYPHNVDWFTDLNRSVRSVSIQYRPQGWIGDVKYRSSEVSVKKDWKAIWVGVIEIQFV